jgi:uncharacterized membrane protein YdjX (TVP38/TMEM64 family)
MNPQPIEVPKASKGEIIRNVIFIGVAIGAAYAITQFIGIETLREKVSELGLWGPLIIVLLKMTTIIVVPLGGGPVYVVAGTLFGFWEGLFYVTVGDTLGFTVAFYLSRFFGRSIVNFFAGETYRATIDMLMTRVSELHIYLKVRIGLFMLPEIFAYGSGLTSVSYLRFIIVQMGVHAPSVVPTILFADLLLTQNVWLFAGASVLALVTAFVSGYWLHKDLFKNA